MKLKKNTYFANYMFVGGWGQGNGCWGKIRNEGAGKKIKRGKGKRKKLFQKRFKIPYDYIFFG